MDRALTQFVIAYDSDAASAELKSRLLDISSTLIFSEGNLQRIFLQTLTSVEVAVKSLQDIFSAFTKTLADRKHTKSVIHLLPSLFVSYASTIQRLSGQLFAPKGASTSSRSAAETHVQLEFRHAIFGFLQSTITLLSSVVDMNTDEQACSASALTAVLQYMEFQPVYAAGPGDANQEWLGVLRHAAQLLQALLADTQASEKAMEGLCALARIDFTAVETALSGLFRAVATRSSDRNEAFLQIAIDYYGKTRQLPHFITMMEGAITSTMTDSSMADVTFRGPLLSLSTRRAITKECSTSLSAAQSIPLLESLLKSCKLQLDQALSLYMMTVDTPHHKKKRRVSYTTVSAPATSSSPEEAASWRFQALSQLLIAVLRSEAELGTGLDTILPLAREIIQRGLEWIKQAGTDAFLDSLQRCVAVSLQLASNLQFKLPDAVSVFPTSMMRYILISREKDRSDTIRPHLLFETVLGHFVISRLVRS